MTTTEAQRLSEFYALLADYGAHRIEVCEGSAPWERLIELHNARPVDILKWQWRVRPVPKYRPWKPKEIPVGALILAPIWDGCPSLIVASNHEGMIAYGAFDNLPFKVLAKDTLGWTYSIDHGVSWKPCGVLE